MTPEEKAAVMQFMGQTYGQAHKNDGMMVSPSANLKPSSDGMKRVFEDTARMPTVKKQLSQQDEQPPPQQINAVTPEQAALEISAQSRVRSEFCMIPH